MGNHEYCSGCGASDFHSGYSCKEAYPKRWAEKEAERKAEQAIVDAETARVDKKTKAILGKDKRFIGKRAVARILAIDVEQAKLREKIESLGREQMKLDNEKFALRKHCPHPPAYYQDGFEYSSCLLCGELF